MACTEGVEAFSDISAEAFAALPKAIKNIEAALQTAFDYDKVNYFMQMMVDPNVHYHVMPQRRALTTLRMQIPADLDRLLWVMGSPWIRAG